MVNTCESLLSAVSPNKPKMLTGLDQKVSDLISIGAVAMESPVRRRKRHRRKGETYPAQ
jgi:hypothetical protein